jgi:SAM-dependent methyltransferase
MTATLYDQVAYPTAIFAQTHPDRMAAIARAAGHVAPPVETARVLEIGGGDGMNLIALAVAYPRARFTSFDLAATAVQRGLEWREALGLGNLELLTLDIMDAAERLQGPFDYIVAHGVYAWVPPPVRSALMALIGRLLAPDGVAFVSYNAQPGGYLRQALRDILLQATEGAANETELKAAAMRQLEDLAAQPDSTPNAFQLALRDAATKSLKTRWEVLRHDELGPFFHPQALRDVVAEARPNGLAFLGDADRELMGDAFLPDDLVPGSDPSGALVKHLQRRDHREIRFFRQTLLVRDTVPLTRRIDLEGIAELLVDSRCEPAGGSQFRIDKNLFEIRDEVLGETLARLATERPRRLRVGDLVETEERLQALFEMFDAGLVDLYTAQAPGALELSERPVSSPLVRMMLDRGMQTVCTLDHRMLGVTEDDPRALLARLDGSVRADELLAQGPFGGLDRRDKLDAALGKCLRENLLIG